MLGTFHKASDTDFKLIVPVVRNKEFFLYIVIISMPFSSLCVKLFSFVYIIIVIIIIIIIIIIWVLSQHSHLPH